eukprot:CAMPEP_0194146666 /NCGR_PEP_ID=MMETSP0152-20130528/21231_1 /TAXON_ID=1049557 /ORGANISM="Thalassiothrix antarctica, Strain L6-D1" /LENGTH=125 /DNA_ID=CAMNT_0038847229 /DNA_START=139 /DNA_END=516 /DNA_ORIENTATION=+
MDINVLDQPEHVIDFIEDHDIEEYQGITVEITKDGDVKQPIILKIMSDNGVLKEEVNLADYESEDDLHTMMEDKGFELKSDEEAKEMYMRYAELGDDHFDDDDEVEDDDEVDDDEEDDDELEEEL